MSATPTIILAVDAPPTTPGIPIWLQIAGALVGLVVSVSTVVVGASTVLGAVLTARKTRLETEKLEKELATSEPRSPTSLETVTAGASSLAVRIQGYLIRFIVLYLAYTFWNIFIALLTTLVSGGVGSLSAIAQRQRSYDVLPYINLAYVIPQVVTVVVNALIFLAIGWPLLKDILGDMGLRPRVFWFRDVSSAFRRANQESRPTLQSEADMTTEQPGSGERSN